MSILWKITPGGKIPVSPEIGLTIIRLIKSDGLVYNNSQNFYYNDNALINKTQLHAAAGINFELLENSRHPLQIGSYMQFGLRPHYRKDYSTRHRIVFGGVRAVWSLSRK
ncbi:MAG: hypothetical protein HC867_04195 [Bacteroidia bacterium]|nr:hypothetical protein [Bacteroidia bacterium]